MNRTEAAEYIKERCFTAYPNTDDSLWDKAMVTAIKALEQPKRKKGKWTEKEVIHTDEAKEIITEWQSCKCSVCGRYHTQPYMYYFDEPRFCSWCGAEMEKGETDGHN